MTTSKKERRRTRRSYTEEEIAFIRENLDKGFRWIAEQLGRSIASVRTAANKRGLFSTHKRGPKKTWTTEQDRLFGVASLREIAQITGRSYAAVKVHSHNIGYSKPNPKLGRGSPWSETENKFLRQHYRPMGPGFCAQKLGRSYGATSEHAAKLGLRGKG